MLQKVVIVQEGQWGIASRQGGDYDGWEKTLGRAIESARREDPVTHEKEKVAEVEFATLSDAMEMVSRSRVDVLVFDSRSMLHHARKVKQAYPKLKVVLFTGLIPEDEVILVSKGWPLGIDMVRRIILE